MTLTLYQGGVVQSSESVQSLILPGNGTLHIGIEQTPTVYEWPLQGAVDEIRIYDRALNAAEVLSLDTAP
jgi:Concanavalin A-like lectin/glucanases superfamily